MINHHGNVKISDLGIIRDLNDDMATACETFTGTYTFMSPERISGNKYGCPADVWSLGLTVMTVAVGKFPYEEAAEGGYWALLQALKDGDTPILNDLVPGGGDFSDEFQDFINQCLTKDPELRPTAEKLLKHPFLSEIDVDVDPGEAADGEELEGDGSDTARSELEDIACVVVDYYRHLWANQSEAEMGLTVPNFNKSKLTSLGKQLGLNVGIIKRKMSGCLKRLKADLEKHGHHTNTSRDKDDENYSSSASSNKKKPECK